LIPLKIGDQVKKRSSVIDVNLKNGKSGLLCFVKAKYEFFVDKKLVIEELHDIVYRDLTITKLLKLLKMIYLFQILILKK
jgi:3-methylfumaryl-CoA hydratase